MDVSEGLRALVISPKNHELFNTIVYVECILVDSEQPCDRLYGVIGGYASDEYQILGKNLMRLDDSDDLVIEKYTGVDK